jgi:predicted transposase YbfD/YdcC
VDAKRNEVNAIRELLDMLALGSAIVTIDAVGTQEQITGGKADYVLAPKAIREYSGRMSCCSRQSRAHDRLSVSGRASKSRPGPDRGAQDHATAWLAERHPGWKGPASVLAMTLRRTIKKTGAVSIETQLFTSSLPPALLRLASAARAHWSVKNNLHWVLKHVAI